MGFLRAIPTLQKSLGISTQEGYGRLDAFGIGRDELFGAIGGNSLPADAPVSFPHIWGMKVTGWLQWGANTNSVMERNIGQALGVGALFDPATFRSTVRLENLHRLENARPTGSTRRHGPTFIPPIDPAKAARGQQHFTKYCAGCHETWTTDGQMREYQLFALAEVGTDPMTALNYERLVQTADGDVQPFPYAAMDLIKRVKNAAYRGARARSRRRSRSGSSASVRAGPRVGPDVPRAAAPCGEVGRHEGAEGLSVEDAGRHLGHRAVSAQRLGADHLRSAQAGGRAAGDVPARTRASTIRSSWVIRATPRSSPCRRGPRRSPSTPACPATGTPGTSGSSTRS